jgi:hypothetical protein
LRDEIEKESSNKKGSKTKTNKNKKNKDQNWHKNKIKLNFKGWNWKTNPINKGIQNQINRKKTQFYKLFQIKQIVIKKLETKSKIKTNGFHRGLYRQMLGKLATKQY